MANILNKSLQRPVTSDEARQIARDACLPPLDNFQVYDKPQPGWQLYDTWDDEPCWYVTVPDEQQLLHGTRVVVISRESGKVLSIQSLNEG